jgi:hypothetical protein
MLLEAAIGPVKTIERHLDRVERIVVRQHLEMNRRVFMSSEADETDLALPLRFVQCFDYASVGEVQVRIVFMDDLVSLPEVQVIRAQALQRFIQLLHCDLFISAMGTNLGHQEDFVAPALQAKPHPLLTAVGIVFPRIIEKRHACVHRLLHQELDQESRPERLPDQRGPSRSHDRARHLVELPPEGREPAEVPLKGGLQLSRGFAAALRRAPTCSRYHGGETGRRERE